MCFFGDTMGWDTSCWAIVQLLVCIWYPILGVYLSLPKQSSRDEQAILEFPTSHPVESEENEQTIHQWLFLVPLKGGRDYITPQKAIYKWYISGIYCQLEDYSICHLPPFRGTRNNHWIFTLTVGRGWITPKKNTTPQTITQTSCLVAAVRYPRLDLSPSQGCHRHHQGWIQKIPPDPETNSKFAPEKWMLGIRSLSFWGPVYFQVRTVSFREGTPPPGPKNSKKVGIKLGLSPL